MTATRGSNRAAAAESRLPSDEDTARRAYLAHLRHELCAPTDAILAYCDLLSAETPEADNTALLADLQKIHGAGETLRDLIHTLLDPAYVERMAAASDTDLDRIAATIRHDLRTPLNAILGYTEMLVEEVEENGDPAEAEAFLPDLRKLHSAATQMLFSINEITQLSGIELAPPEQDADKRKDNGDAALIHEAIASLRLRTRNFFATASPPPGGHLLVVDDNAMNRDILTRQLERQGHHVTGAENGASALERAAANAFDLILLDILMPGMSGYEVLERLKADPVLRDIPVIMLSSLDELDSVVRCIEMGAEDYVAKPFNPVFLKARIDACLDKKRLRDREKAYLEELHREREKSEKLLLNVLPESIALRLKEREGSIADQFSEATVLFADIVGFTELSSRMPPTELVDILNTVFSRFDRLVETHGLQKIKTIGDAYMVAGGVPVPHDDHVHATAQMALALLQEVEQLRQERFPGLQVRIGFHTGPVVAGIIGTTKFSYDLWGDTVNLAHRMESCGVPGRIQLSAAAAECLKDRFHLEERGNIPVKGKGEMSTYFLRGPRQTG